MVIPPDGCVFLPEQNSAIFAYSDVGVIAIESGAVIRINPDARIAYDALSQILLSMPMRLLLHQRGFLVFHGGAVAIEGKSVAFLGHSGQGKSTLVAHLHAQGHAFITDDTLAAEICSDGTIALRTAPSQIRLWPDSLTAMGEQPETVETFYPNYDKRLFRDIVQMGGPPPTLSRIYVLETTTDETHLQALTPAQALQYVMTYSFAGELTLAKKNPFKDQRARIEHFRKCAVVAQRVPARVLARRRDFAEMPAVLDMLVRDVTGLDAQG